MAIWLRRHPWRAVLLATWGAWFAVLWPRWFAVRADGIWAGQPFIWADWSAHLTYVSRFLYTPPSQWLAHHPIFYLEKWTYPPLTNLLSAGLAALGLPLQAAMLLPVIAGTMAILVLLFAWFAQQHLSERVSFIGTSLFLLSGSWGWPLWLWSVWHSTDPVSEIIFPSQLYTQVFDHYLVWLNPIAGMILPQRSFTVGFPLLLIILLMLRHRLVDAAPVTTRTTIICSLLSVALFFTHTHSFLTLMILCAVWALAWPRRWRWWLGYAFLTGALTFPWYWLVLRGSGVVAAWSIDLGWMSPEPWSPLSWVWFWCKNWGPLLPLAAYGWWRTKLAEQRWQLGFWVLFVFANIVRTQNYDWDNSKLLIVVLLGLLPAMLQALGDLRRRLPRWLGAGVIVVVILGSIGGGALEAVRLSQPNRTFWQMAGPDEIEFAQQVREIIPADEVVLTADQHNHPVPMLAGRPVLLGYIGWVWSYGFDYNQLERDVQIMYTDPQQSASLRQKYGVRWVVIGPAERRKFGLGLAPENSCTVAGQNQDYALYSCAN